MEKVVCDQITSFSDVRSGGISLGTGTSTGYPEADSTAEHVGQHERMQQGLSIAITEHVLSCYRDIRSALEFRPRCTRPDYAGNGA